ncbi:hypothetical protein Hypma_006591 [Hypsizygus marmoreus]|uniref:CFEM domain-containing protein n=1 Tax=Hypsizygus marmoreus TaxID=39966 RepID=A0A369JUY9_HYPMA|nr:hypothetical protein Hypma_006591 [Hypsizygus marmoreus]
MPYLMSLLSVLFTSQLPIFAWGVATLLPPSTFEGPSTSTTTSTTASGSGNGTSTTSTSTAQFPSLSGYSPCVSNCLAVGSSSANCTSVVQVDCFCKSKRYTPAIVKCIANACPAELLTAESLAQKFCDLASHSTSLSFPSTSITSSSTSTSSGTTPPATSANGTTPPATSTITAPADVITTPPPTSNAASQGAPALRIFGNSPILSIGVPLLGMLFGAFLVV